MASYQAKIVALKKLKSSIDGSPCYQVYLATGDVLETAPGHAVGYAIAHPAYREQVVELTVNRWGRITDAMPVVAV